jgi:hypothetical protein
MTAAHYEVRAVLPSIKVEVVSEFDVRVPTAGVVKPLLSLLLYEGLIGVLSTDTRYCILSEMLGGTTAVKLVSVLGN